MTSAPTTRERIETAVAALGSGPLTERNLREHIAPLFARVLGRSPRIYLANHSLGRPLDAMEDDVREATSAWYARMGDAWGPWIDELGAHRARLARLIGAPRADCVVPKTSAGAGLRAVLNSYADPPRVVATRGEFDSLDLILRTYAHRGRISLTLVEPRTDDTFAADDVMRAIAPGTDLVVLSEAMFTTGQLISSLDAIVERAHDCGAKLLLDVYHSLAVVPVDVARTDVDFAVGGSYKYLRGGPGACFLYVAPRHLDAGLATLDVGWFAKEAAFSYARPDPPRFAAGGDAWLESTPPVLTWYQARSGQLFTLAIGVERLRAYSLEQQRLLVESLQARGIEAHGGTQDRGAFVVVQRENASALADALDAANFDVDARGPYLRLCPDVLTTSDELARATDALAQALRN